MQRGVEGAQCLPSWICDPEDLHYESPNWNGGATG
jgi:hypothetical protein